MRLALAATAAIICVAPTAFGQTQHDTTTIQSIQNLCKAYDAGYNAKGPAGDAEFYAQDAVVVAPNGAVLQGRDAIIKAFVTAQPPPRYSGLQANLYVGTSVEEVQTRL